MAVLVVSSLANLLSCSLVPTMLYKSFAMKCFRLVDIACNERLVAADGAIPMWVQSWWEAPSPGPVPLAPLLLHECSSPSACHCLSLLSRRSATGSHFAVMASADQLAMALRSSLASCCIPPSWFHALHCPKPRNLSYTPSLPHLVNADT